MRLIEEFGKFSKNQEVGDMRQEEHLREIILLQRGREAETNMLRDKLVGCNALILDQRGKIKFLEEDTNSLKTELESLRLEYECSKSTTKEY